MKIIAQFALILATVPCLAKANVSDDLNRVRALLPMGTDVAQYQAAVLMGVSEADALQAAAANYLIRDINGDGFEDILVITEKNPHLENFQTNQPCVQYGDDCMVAYSQRALNLYYGDKAGSMTLAFSNDRMVLNGDEGGVMGDPLIGLEVRKNGSITVSFYGGSNYRWSYKTTMQFRGGDFVVIGEDSENTFTGDGSGTSKSINLITGTVVEKSFKSFDGPVRKKRTQVPVQPLVPVAKYEGPVKN